ncbi:MAG: bifunctional riboflavin kinase/FAD synthetase [Polyangiaceae bacterium]|nr:bifunctional riboflavin kinase/FAD synthetase [Polyangiaceae bacterium]
MVQAGQISKSQGRLVVIGNFDGVHRGHQSVIHEAGAQAAESQLILTVLTFDPHPAAVIRGQAPALITPLERKLALLKGLPESPDIEVLRFSRELAALSPRDFVQQVLVERLRTSSIFVGENFRFGRDRAGDLDDLRLLGQELCFSAQAIPLKKESEKTLSSSRVRALLAEGCVTEAGEILGRPHLWGGRVVAGDGRGRAIGFPTANLEEGDAQLPAEGVYAIDAFVGEKRVPVLPEGDRLPGLVHIGPRPTVERPNSVEVHLFDREELSTNLYGQHLLLGFRGKVRNVERFDGVEKLKQQISRDIEVGREILRKKENF